MRYSWQDLYEETGISSEEIGMRAADFGMHYWTSHHPYVVPQPFTLEPTESYSKAEMDEYVAVLAEVAARSPGDPELVRTAPHNQTVHHTHHDDLDDPERWAMTWRAYQRKYFSADAAGAGAAQVASDASAASARSAGSASAEEAAA